VEEEDLNRLPPLGGRMVVRINTKHAATPCTGEIFGTMTMIHMVVISQREAGE
jgi:hypothetical protein